MEEWSILKHVRLVDSTIQTQAMAAKVAEFDDAAIVEEIEYIKYAYDNLTLETERILALYNDNNFLAINNRKKLEAVYMLHYADVEIFE